MMTGISRLASAMGHLAKQALRIRDRADSPDRAGSIRHIDFLCNICGKANVAVARDLVANREEQSCGHCGSSLRMRSVIYALSMELFGKALPLPNFPRDKSIHGLGMSDWTGYAQWLEKKFSYTNTFYHTQPRLDITNPAEKWLGKQRFVISSDVFEHIPILGLQSAFQNSRKLLVTNGVFIFTAPFTKEGKNQEHFPSLNDFRFLEVNGKRTLHNRKHDGTEETFENLVFHGGDGSTLEMRIFSEPDLRNSFAEAGFSNVKVYSDIVPEYGILWPMDWAVPVAVRA